ncbi:MAG: hypothetical protein ACR2QS_08150 [Woeseiaceae bacterium]
MSPRVFVAELTPDCALRKCLITSVLLTVAAGVWSISTLPIAPELCWLGSVGWGLAVGVRSGLIIRSQSRYCQLNFHADGSVLLLDLGGHWQSASWSRNSVILSNLAWIDLTMGGGRRFSGLFYGNSRESEQWRRLQVIWRHMGSGL